MKILTKTRYWYSLSGLFLLLIFACLVGINLGAEHVNIFVQKLDDVQKTIIFTTRLPRIILGALVGASLATCGVAFQSLLRNPLADPYILGVSGGAALGSIIALGLKLSPFLIPAVAFGGALAATFVIFFMARTHGRLSTHTLLLSGVVFNAFAFSLIMLINSLVTREEAHEIIFFLMGGLEIYSYPVLLLTAVIVVVCLVLLFAAANKFNLMSLGDDTASCLGVDSERFRRAIFLIASLLVGTVVAVSGMIGFVGIFVPHFLRIIFGPNHRLLIPAAALGGASFLILADTFARTVLSGVNYQTELPVGVITALLGGPFFLLIMRKQLR